MDRHRIRWTLGVFDCADRRAWPDVRDHRATTNDHLSDNAKRRSNSINTTLVSDFMVETDRRYEAVDRLGFFRGEAPLGFVRSLQQSEVFYCRLRQSR